MPPLTGLKLIRYQVCKMDPLRLQTPDVSDLGVWHFLRSVITWTTRGANSEHVKRHCICSKKRISDVFLTHFLPQLVCKTHIVHWIKSIGVYGGEGHAGSSRHLTTDGQHVEHFGSQHWMVMAWEVHVQTFRAHYSKWLHYEYWKTTLTKRGNTVHCRR